MSHSFFSGAYSDISALFICADLSACGHYRQIFPAEFLQRGGANITLIRPGVLDGSLLDKHPIVLVQRQHTQSFYDTIFSIGRKHRTILYEVDDNLHRVHPTSNAYSTFKPGSQILHVADRFMRDSDGLFLSTNELASQYADRNSRIWVLPNYIDFGIRDWESPVERDPRLEGKIVIGWAGGSTHQDDWEPLVGSLKEVLEEYPNVVFGIASAHFIIDLWMEALDLPKEKVVRLPTTDFQNYPRIPANFDIAICPLVNTVFNRAKSALRILELGARGAPYVASNVAPFAQFHQETGGQCGYLVSSKSEWLEAMTTLIENEDERKQRSQLIRDTIRTQYSYENNVWKWAEALREARDMKVYNPTAERRDLLPQKVGRNDLCPCGSQKKLKKCCKERWG